MAGKICQELGRFLRLEPVDNPIPDMNSELAQQLNSDQNAHPVR
jgi:hypothetical protein